MFYIKINLVLFDIQFPAIYTMLWILKMIQMFICILQYRFICKFSWTIFQSKCYIVKIINLKIICFKRIFFCCDSSIFWQNSIALSLWNQLLIKCSSKQIVLSTLQLAFESIDHFLMVHYIISIAVIMSSHSFVTTTFDNFWWLFKFDTCTHFWNGCT